MEKQKSFGQGQIYPARCRIKSYDQLNLVFIKGYNMRLFLLVNFLEQVLIFIENISTMREHEIIFVR